MASFASLNIPNGVVTGENVLKILQFAKENEFAIPAVNCVSSSSVNTVFEAAKAANSPVIVQVSNGGAHFFAGKSMSNDGQKAAVAGSVAFAHHARVMAKHYNIPVIVHSDHCAKNLLPWLDGMLEADEEYFAKHGEPLFSSHMIDLSEEPMEENIDTCAKYLTRFAKVNLLLELELGITGGEEDGVDNTGVDNASLYSQPEDIHKAYVTLGAISPMFTIAAAFGNVHGVYKPGNVKLTPSILQTAQTYVQEKSATKDTKPVYFVFHGGSGSEKDKIQTALKAGVIKMNIDTDTQWAYWDGVRAFEAKNRDYLQGQIGNPTGADKPNKKFYDPRAWLRSAEQAMVTRLQEAFTDLNCQNRLA